MQDDEFDELEPVLPLGLASLLAIVSERERRALLKSDAVGRGASGLLDIARELSEIQERGLMGMPEPGDRFRTFRLLTRVPQRELIRLIIELGLPDEDAVFGWQMSLRKRPSSPAELEVAKTERQRRRAEDRVRREDEMARRVLAYRHRNRVTLEKAIEDIAAAKDNGGDLLGSAIRRVQSQALVRKLYMAGIKRARATGYVRGYGRGLFANRPGRPIPIEHLTRKGRRPEK